MAIKTIIMIFTLFAATAFGGRLSASEPYFTPKQLAMKRFKLCQTYYQILGTPEYKLKASTMKQFASMCKDYNKFQASFRGWDDKSL